MGKFVRKWSPNPCRWLQIIWQHDLWNNERFPTITLIIVVVILSKLIINLILDLTHDKELVVPGCFTQHNQRSMCHRKVHSHIVSTEGYVITIVQPIGDKKKPWAKTENRELPSISKGTVVIWHISKHKSYREVLR